MAFDYMHPPEDFEYLGEWCKAWRDPATGDWTISQLLDGLETEQIILSGEEVRELARLAAQHDPTDYELEYGELRRPMFGSPDENGTAVNAAEGAGGEQGIDLEYDPEPDPDPKLALFWELLEEFAGCEDTLLESAETADTIIRLIAGGNAGSDGKGTVDGRP